MARDSAMSLGKLKGTQIACNLELKELNSDQHNYDAVHCNCG